MLWILLFGCLLVFLGILASRYFFGVQKYSLRGRHVLITGGSSGIGKSLAFESVKRGASVTLVARNEEKLKAAKEEVEAVTVVKNKQKVQYVSVDIGGDYTHVADAVKKATDAFGPVDVLINCAGITHCGTLEETPSEVYQKLYQTNVLGSVNVTKATLPMMKKQKQGRIVFVSSQAGQCAIYGYTAYAGTKFALRGIAECLQMEVKPYNILVSMSFPPDTDTPQLKEELDTRSAIANEIAASSGVFKPEQIAKEILDGVQVSLSGVVSIALKQHYILFSVPVSSPKHPISTHIVTSNIFAPCTSHHACIPHIIQ
jgi:3-dehydrosphinganine reductase